VCVSECVGVCVRLVTGACLLLILEFTEF